MTHDLHPIPEIFSAPLMKSIIVILVLGIFCPVSGSTLTDDPVQRGAELPSDYFYRGVVPNTSKDGDPLGDLVSNSPDVLRRNALELLEQAQKLKEALYISFDPNEPIRLTRSERLVQMASRAVLIPGEFEDEVLAKRWSVWWYKNHVRIPFDTRLAADQFLDYAVKRAYGEIADTKCILGFELIVDNMFVTSKLGSQE